MRLLWTIKLYKTGSNAKPSYKVRVEGYKENDLQLNVYSSTGKGTTPDEALQAACSMLVVKPWLARGASQGPQEEKA